MPCLTAEHLLSDPDYDASHCLAKKISHRMKGKTFHTHFHLLYLLRKLLGESEKTYLEVGSFFGASLCLMLSSFYPTKVYGIDSSFFIDKRCDILKQNIDFFWKERHLHKLGLLPGKSQDPSIKKRVESQVKCIDLLYLDGDRSKEGLSKDLHFYSQFVPKGGFIVIDDYHDTIYCPGVSQAIKENQEWIENNFYTLSSIPNLASAGITDPYKFKIDKYPKPVYNQMLILQKKG